MWNLTKASGLTRDQTSTRRSVATWPSLDSKRIEVINTEGCGLTDLWECSPIRIDDNRPHTEAIIDSLFPGNPLLCCGRSQSEFDTRPREEWRGELTTLQFIVPSPMTAITGKTKTDGHESKHTLENTGSRRFLVCEFDSGTTDEHAALLLHLAGYAPMICALHSGGKSIHGWFFVAGQPADRIWKFFRYAVSLGAEPRMWTPCQFARMPDGARDNGRRQTVFFLSFKPLEGHR